MKKTLLTAALLLSILFIGCGEEATVTLATESSFPPFDYKDGEAFTGIDNDIGLRIAKKLGKKLVIADIPFESIIPALVSKKVDFAAAGMGITEIREKVVSFSNPYFENTHFLFVPLDDSRFDEAKNCEDVASILNSLGKKLSVGVQTGTTAEFYLRREFDWDFLALKDVEVKNFPNPALAVTSMLSGQIDLVLADKTISKVLASRQPVKFIDIPLTPVERVAIAVNKENTALLKSINEVIDEMKKDGSLNASIENHYLKATKQP